MNIKANVDSSTFVELQTIVFGMEGAHQGKVSLSKAPSAISIIRRTAAYLGEQDIRVPGNMQTEHGPTTRS